MKANELSCRDLMVGDWVYLPSIMSDDKYPIQVLEIQDDCIKYYCGDKKMMVGFKYVEPIPLTPEILEKNGFKFDKEDGWWWLTPKIGITFWEEGDIELDFENTHSSVDIHIKYVYQLQHALRLCGINHEIIL